MFKFEKAPLGYPGRIEHFGIMFDAVADHVVGITPEQGAIYSNSVIEPAARACHELRAQAALTDLDLRQLLNAASTYAVFIKADVANAVTPGDL